MICVGFTDWIMLGYMMAALNAFLKRHFRSNKFNAKGRGGGKNR